MNEQLATRRLTALEVCDAIRPKLGNLRAYYGKLYRKMSDNGLRHAVLSSLAKRGDDTRWQRTDGSAAANGIRAAPQRHILTLT